MIRLIDAESLYKAISDVGFPALNRNGYIDRNCVYELIKKAPTVTPDMAQVLAYESGKSSNRKKGEWTFRTEGIFRFMKCSNCHMDYSPSLHPRNFCPNCGADMRGGQEDD